MTPERDAALRAVVERQLEIERKAAAWDALYAFVQGPGHAPGLLARMDELVHPAQEVSTR